MLNHSNLSGVQHLNVDMVHIEHVWPWLMWERICLGLTRQHDIPSHVLRGCTDQLHLQHLFEHLSFPRQRSHQCHASQQSTLPTIITKWFGRLVTRHIKSQLTPILALRRCACHPTAQWMITTSLHLFKRIPECFSSAFNIFFSQHRKAYTKFSLHSTEGLSSVISAAAS